MKIESKQLQVKLICTVFLLQHHPWIPFILFCYLFLGRLLCQSHEHLRMPQMSPGLLLGSELGCPRAGHQVAFINTSCFFFLWF